MKKLFTILCALVLGSALSFAQAGSTGSQAPADQGKTTTESGKKGHKGSKKGHKGGKKSKKGAGDAGTTPPPK